MKSSLKKILCVILSLMLLFSTGISAFAASKANTTTPVVVINGMDANPIIKNPDTDERSVVFDISDYQYDLLFTSGFSENFTDLFSKETLEGIQNGDIKLNDILTMLEDYMGYSDDISAIISKVLEIATGIMSKVDMDNLDVQSILAAIDFKGYAQQVKDYFSSLIENLKLLKMNEDGTPAYDNIGVNTYPKSLEYYFDDDSDNADKISGQLGQGIAEKIGYDNTYIFTYDWRLDPIANAEKLDAYIANVKTQSRSEKVSIMSEGYGSTVATTYLSQFADSAKNDVKNFVTVSSAFEGTSLIADYFSGEIVNELTNITTYSSAYIRFTNDISDNPTTAFSTWLTNYVLNNEWEVQGFCTHVKEFVSDAEYAMKFTGFTAMLGNMPGLWALVPSDRYSEAYDNMFDSKTANKDLYAKIDAFKTIQSDPDTILQEAKDDGINVYVVASWDLQIVPIGETNGVQSDGYIDTTYQSFGATCIDLNNVGEATKATQTYEDKHDHLSDTYDMLTPTHSMAGIAHYIDASTCALPENTWFIQNMKHGSFTMESNSMTFILWLITSDTERTVWDNTAYGQFMQYNRYINPGKLSTGGVVYQEVVPGDYLMGDVDLDTHITANDARLALRIAAGLDSLDENSIAFKNGDVYSDGVINAADARKILLMSAGLIDYMTSGIKFDYMTEQGSLEKSDYQIRLDARYNSAVDTVDVKVVLLDAANSSNGNFILKFNTEDLTYKTVKTANITDCDIVAGAPIEFPGTLTCAFSATKSIKSSDCNSDGDLVLATFTFTTNKEIASTSLTAGASYMFDNGKETYVQPVVLDLDESFFFMLGDADNNRYISAADARLILRIAAQLETVTDAAMFKRCDVNCDGLITASDARLVLRASAHLITDFATEDVGVVSSKPID